MSGGVLDEGERVILIDAKDRHYLVTLRAGASFHTHAGIVQHDDLIGATEGSLIRGNTERSFLVLRPTLSDVVLKMPRGAQVIYPKDLGAILLQADIGPGMRVLEAGVGSGALSMTLLRAGALVTAYEIREDFAVTATKNVHDLLGEVVTYDVQSVTSRPASTSATLTGSSWTCPSPGTSSPTRTAPCGPGESCWRTCRRSTRPSGCARRCAPTHSASKRPSRYYDGPGTSTAGRSARTTGWWPIPGLSPRLGAWPDPQHGLVALDEDALARALLGGLDDGVFHSEGTAARPSAPPGEFKTLPSCLT